MNPNPLPDLDLAATAAVATVAVASASLADPPSESSRLAPSEDVGTFSAPSETLAVEVYPVEMVAWVATCWAIPCEVHSS